MKMIKPIDMQVVVKSVDHVAKINKIHEQTLVGQQTNAQNEMSKSIKNHMKTVTHGEHAEGKGVNSDENGNSEYSSREHNKKEKSDEERHEKAKEPNKGKLIDLEG